MINFYELLQTPWDSSPQQIRAALEPAERGGKIKPDLLSAIGCVLSDDKLRQDYNQRLAAYYDELDQQQS